MRALRHAMHARATITTEYYDIKKKIQTPKDTAKRAANL